MNAQRNPWPRKPSSAPSETPLLRVFGPGERAIMWEDWGALLRPIPGRAAALRHSEGMVLAGEVLKVTARGVAEVETRALQLERRSNKRPGGASHTRPAVDAERRLLLAFASGQLGALEDIAAKSRGAEREAAQHLMRTLGRLSEALQRSA